VRQRLCAVGDVTDGLPVRFDVGPHRICLVRLGDDFYAIGDTCSHADVSLSEGEVDADTKHIECWKHGSCFSLETGVPDVLPATRPVPVYRVSVEGDDVVVEVDR
jgi:3-phenylpropionate/trans-cinnamate dioxygenase ferredoxin component